VYEQQEKTTMIASCLREFQVKMLWRFDKDEEAEYKGTRKSIVHQGNGCLAQFQEGSRKQPCRSSAEVRLDSNIVSTFDDMLNFVTFASKPENPADECPRISAIQHLKYAVGVCWGQRSRSSIIGTTSTAVNNQV
jgi:hypothetical protein